MTRATRDDVLRRIDAVTDEAIAFLRDFARTDTSNPPGDTRAGAALIAGLLGRKGAAFETIAPRADMPNLVASCAFARPGRHLVLNGHIDVFPPGPRELWERDPLSGDLAGGRVHGRGTVDMKCGTTALIFAYLLLREMDGDIAGKVTLTVVSDEETGGRWGSGYLLDHHADRVLGDVLLNAEPSSPWTVRFGEKAPAWFRFRIRTPGAHSAYAHVSKSATKIAARLMLDLERLEDLVPAPPESVRALLSVPATERAIERAMGRGAVRSLNRVTVNFGLISGGVKINLLPGECTLEADIRMPVGTTSAEIAAEVRRIAAAYPEVTVEEMIHTPMDPTCSDPDHEMVGLLCDTAASFLGERPAPIVTLGGTDCRFWRQRGVPAFVYGPSPDRMGVPNESVSVDEFLLVLRTHTLAAFRYLASPPDPAGAGRGAEP